MSEHIKYKKAFKLYGQKLFDHYSKKFPDEKLGSRAEDVFERISSYDPTHDAKEPQKRFQFLDWMARNLIKGEVSPQDLFKVRDDLILFTRKIKSVGNPNIDNYTLSSLAEVTFPFLGELTEPSSADQKRLERDRAEKNSVIFYDGHAGKILMPQTMEASQFWGRGTRWCISATQSDNLFDQYHQKGKTPILMFLPKGTQEKFAFTLKDEAMRNARDDEVRKSPEVLKNFLGEALYALQSKVAFQECSSAVQKTLREGMMQVCDAYQHVLRSGEAHALPSCISPAVMVEELVKKSQDISWWSVDNGSVNVIPLFSHPAMLLEFKKIDPAQTDTIRSALSSVEMDDDVFEWCKEEFTLSEDDLHDRDHILSRLKDFNSLMTERSQLFGHCGFDSLDLEETLAEHLLSQIPVSYWDDIKFTMDVIQSFPHFRSGLVSEIPEIIRHPEVVLYFTKQMYEDGSDFFADFLKGTPEVWSAKIEGQSFMEAVLPQSFDNFYLATEFAGAAKLGRITDFSHLEQKINMQFSDGLPNREDLDLALYSAEDMDVSFVVERTIERHPDWFEDVPASRQTLVMAAFAVAHNPEALLDVRSDFLRSANHPVEFDAAFVKLKDGPTKSSLEPFFGHILN